MKQIESEFLSNLFNYSLVEVEDLIYSVSNNQKIKQNDIISLPKIDQNIQFFDSLRESILNMLEEVAKEKTEVLINNFLKEEEFTIQEVADYLNTSHSHIIKLVEQHRLSASKIGKNYKVKMYNVFEYENYLKERQNKNLKELAKQAQKLNLGYE